jgi:hypothetical protein
VRWLGFVGTAVFVGAAVWSVTPKQRRRAAAIGTPAWVPAVLAVIGVAYAAGAVIDSVLPMLAGIAILIPTNMVTRKRLADRDVPPALRRMYDVSNNPLTLWRHPISHSRQLFRALGRPLANKRQTDEWYEDRGL